MPQPFMQGRNGAPSFAVYNASAYIRENNESTSRTGILAFWTVDK